MNKSPVVDKRCEIVLLFDVIHGNPNGDPDAGNAPRVDPETGYGIVTDVCLKRKVRNFVALTREYKPPYDIYVKERGILANQQKRAYEALGAQPDAAGRANEQARAWMCQTFFDVRTFGAVMTTGKTGEEEPANGAVKGSGIAGRSAVRCNSASHDRLRRSSLWSTRSRASLLPTPATRIGPPPKPAREKRRPAADRWGGSMRYHTRYTALTGSYLPF